MKLTKLAPVFYVNKVPGNQKAGRCYGFFILIDKRYKDDIGLHQHEYLHSLIFYIISAALIVLGMAAHIDPQLLPFSFLAFFLLNLISDYRYHHEVACYKHQMKFCKNKSVCLEKFASRITTCYRLPKRFHYKRALRDLSK